MTDPHEVFQQIFHLLKDGGVCEIAIPVVPNLAFELFRENWYQLDAPRHTFLHSKSRDAAGRKGKTRRSRERKAATFDGGSCSLFDSAKGSKTIRESSFFIK